MEVSFEKEDGIVVNLLSFRLHISRILSNPMVSGKLLSLLEERLNSFRFLKFPKVEGSSSSALFSALRCCDVNR